MNPLILQMSDANTITGLAQSVFDVGLGGDWVLAGIVLFLGIAVILLMGRVRSSGVTIVGVSFAFLLTMFVPSFAFVFWLGIIVGIFMLLMGFRKQTTGQQ